MGGSYIKMMKTKQSGKKATYDKKFYDENKCEYQMKSKINYYSRNTNMTKTEIDEMMNGYGIDEALRLLKIKKQEEKLSAMVCF